MNVFAQLMYKIVTDKYWSGAYMPNLFRLASVVPFIDLINHLK